MVHIIDFNSYENSHLLFNVSMLKVWLAITEQPITLYVQESHWKQLQVYFSHSELSRLSHHATHLKKRNVSGLSKAVSIVNKTYNDLFTFHRILKSARKGHKDLIFVCTAHSISLLLLHYLKKVYPLVPVISTVHGEVEFVYFTQNKWEIDTGRLYKRIFKTRPPRFFYLFLNKISKRQLVKDQYVMDSQSIEIDHPYVYNHTEQARTDLGNGIITIAHVGSMGIRKSAHLLYDLAALNGQLIEKNLLDFWNIGPIEDNVLPYKSGLVKDFTSADGKSYIPRSVFDEKLRSIDYAVFFYNAEQFLFRASGAVHDVINFNKPIIVLEHPYFEYLFQQAGNIGFICKNLSDMSLLIQRLVARDPAVVDQYAHQCDNLVAYKKRNDVSFIATDFKKQIASLL
jgi:hypothetical protein